MRTASELSASTGTNHCEPLFACVAGKIPFSTRFFANSPSGAYHDDNALLQMLTMRRRAASASTSARKAIRRPDTTPNPKAKPKNLIGYLRSGHIPIPTTLWHPFIGETPASL
jgi:hypothetical protein